MPKVVREDIDNLNAVITVTIEKADYEPKLNEKLKELRKKSNFKGFRKGKTPLSFVKKMYGQQVLGEVINDVLQEQVGEALSDENVKFIGQPIESSEHDPIDLSIKDLDDYEFKFDIGKAPEFEVKGVEPDTVYEQYAVEIPAKDIDQDLEAMRKRGAERQFIEEDIQEEDMVKLSVRELVGDGLVKAGGREAEFSVLMNRVDSESLKAELLSKKKGDTVRFNIFEVENHDSQDYAKKYFLNMTPEEIEEAGEIGPMFEGEIIEVSRVEPVELNQEFFDKNFGEGEVSSEAEAKEKIKENISQFYVGQTEAVLFRNFQDKLLEENREAMPLPDDFLKRWLVTASDKNTEELVEKDYPHFSDNLRWSLIKGQLSERFEVKVEEEDIKDEIRKQVAQMMGNYGMGEEFIDMMVQRSMQDPKVMEETANRALDNKLFDVVKEKVTIQETPISAEEFGKVLEELKKSVAEEEEE